MQRELGQLADHLGQRREEILRAWRTAVRRDPLLTTSHALPRAQLNDHVPGVLIAFEEALRATPAPVTQVAPSAEASAHGVHRWQQGYDLHEVTRELGMLNRSMVTELDAYAAAHPETPHAVMAHAREMWAASTSTDLEESTSQYFRLQRVEAAGHVKELEIALERLNELESQRGELWQQIAHDLRGNVGVVATAARGLSLGHTATESREKFIRILGHNVSSLKHLLDDVTSLARLQAGSEVRQLVEMDVATEVTDLCEGLQGLAQERGLYLRTSGPAPFPVTGDPVKTRRLVQNLVLNALKYTPSGGVDVHWEETLAYDDPRWVITVKDTGPGIQAGPGSPMAVALQGATQLTLGVERGVAAEAVEEAVAHTVTPPAGSALPARAGAGEGIGLSIVKRLADLLDASVELESGSDTGTTFRVLFPKVYAAG
jgi:signal transduction histidine kinase